MLLSSQSGAAPPTQVPLLQVSTAVHALPSSQLATLFVCTHPVDTLHESSVQTSLSLQSGAAPPTHSPLLHVSLVVHALPSSQADPLFALTHPVPTSHESFVQTLLSLQFGGELPMHTPPLQVSTVVHALPSSQLPDAAA